MFSYRSMLIAWQLVMLSLAFGACIAIAQPPDLPLLPPPKKAQAPDPQLLPLPQKVKPLAKSEPKPDKKSSVVVTRVPVEFSVSVADLEKQMLRSIIQKIDPKAKPEFPIVVKGNARDLRANAPDMRAAKDAKDAPQLEMKEPEPRRLRPRIVALPPPVQPGVQPAMPPAMLPEMPPGRPRLLARPLGSRVVERPVLRPALAELVERFAELPNLNYRIELRSFDLAISGQTLTCEVGGGFHSEEKAPPALPGQPPLPPPNVRDISIKLTVTKELVWNESGKLELKEGTSQVWIDPDAPIIGFPRLDIVRVIQLNGLLTLLNGVVDRQVMKQLSGEAMPDLTLIAPKVEAKLPFLALAEITAYPLHSDGKDLYIPLVVGLVPSNKKKTDDEVKITTETGPPPEPRFRGKIVFDANGKPDAKLDPVK
jgi:hypothetical protein